MQFYATVAHPPLFPWNSRPSISNRHEIPTHPACGRMSEIVYNCIKFIILKNLYIYLFRAVHYYAGGAGAPNREHSTYGSQGVGRRSSKWANLDAPILLIGYFSALETIKPDKLNKDLLTKIWFYFLICRNYYWSVCNMQTKLCPLRA